MNPDINKVFFLHATASNWHWQPCSPRSHPICSPFWFSLWSSASRLHHLYMMPCDCPISCLYEGAVEAFTIESSWWVYTGNGRALPVWEYCCSSTTETLTSSFMVFGDLSRQTFFCISGKTVRITSSVFSASVFSRFGDHHEVRPNVTAGLTTSTWVCWGSLHDYTCRFTVFLKWGVVKSRPQELRFRNRMIKRLSLNTTW